MLTYVLVPTYITTIIHKAEGKGVIPSKKALIGRILPNKILFEDYDTNYNECFSFKYTY